MIKISTGTETSLNTLDNMKKYVLITACFLTFLSNAYAKKEKAGVLVFGATPAGIAAAIQSAHSGVPTVLIEQGNLQSLSLAPADTKYNAGIYWELKNRMDSLNKKASGPASTLSDPAFAARTVKGWTDTIKNLTVYLKASVKKIKKDGKRWEIELTDGKEFKPDVVVDATPGNLLAKRAGSTAKSSAAPAAGAYTSILYRTGVAAIESANYPATLPLSALLADTENLILLGTDRAPASILTGQAAGATAAFCAFYNTTTRNLNVRVIQGELLGYKTQLLQFDDVSLQDSTFAAIQRIAITGIMKGSLNNGHFLFNPDGSVSSEDIRLPVREFYTRSQIWFLDNKQDSLTVGDALELIKFTVARGDELYKEVEKGWNSSLKLEGKFDRRKKINRKELAVLIDRFMRPFDRPVDISGNLKM